MRWRSILCTETRLRKVGTSGVVERWSAGKWKLQAATCLSLLHTARSANLDPIRLLQMLLLEGHAPVAAALIADSS